MANSKLSAFFSILLVFCSGAAVGIVGTRVYTTSVIPTPKGPERRMPPDPADVRKMLVDEMTREVHLDSKQVEELGQIYDETRVRFEDLRKKSNLDGRAIWEDQVSKIKGMLRADQVPLYESLRARKEVQRDEERKRRSHGKGPGEIHKDQ